MDDEYTATLPVKGKDPNNYHRELTDKITVHIAFCDFNSVRPFTQADTTKFDERDVTRVNLTYCLIRWKNPDGTIRHVVGCTVKNPKDKNDYLQARRHAFGDALHQVFPGYFVLNPKRQNKDAVPYVIDERSQHTANRATFWKWFREVVEPEIKQEDEKEWGESPAKNILSDMMYSTWLSDFTRAFLRGHG